MWLFDLTTDLLKYKFCKGRQQQQSFSMHFIHIFLTIDANPTCRLSFIPWPPEALNFQLYACYFLIIVVASVYKERKRAKTITPIFLDTIIIKNITHHNAPGKLFLSVILRLQKTVILLYYELQIIIKTDHKFVQAFRYVPIEIWWCKPFDKIFMEHETW